MNEQEKAIIEQCQKWYDEAEAKTNSYLQERALEWAGDYMHGLSMACTIFDCTAVLKEIYPLQIKCRNRAAEIRGGNHD
jgi:hypothetical protein